MTNNISNSIVNCFIAKLKQSKQQSLRLVAKEKQRRSVPVRNDKKTSIRRLRRIADV